MFIENAYLFQEVSPGFMAEVTKGLTREIHRQGEILFKAGDPAQFLYILEAGRVRLSAGDRGMVTHIVEKEGDALGWSSLVGRESYSSSAECLTDTTLAKIPKDKLDKIFDDFPYCAFLLFRRLARMLGERLVESYRQISAEHPDKEGNRYGFSG